MLRINRILIIEYTNGEKTLHGVPFIYGRTTFENVENGIGTMKEQYEKYPATWWAPVTAPLVDAKVKSVQWNEFGYYIDRTDIFMPDAAGGDLIRSANLKSVLFMKYTENVGDGLLSLSNQFEDLKICDSDYLEIKSDALRIWYHLKLKR